MAEADAPAARNFRIGPWTFLPAENALEGPRGRRRLEHRAARTLEYLCRHRGAVVPRETLIGEIWNGRLVSPNSLSIVISDLREALDDDARSPEHIETVAKRGYRLLGDAEEAVPPQPRKRRWPIAVGAAATLLIPVAAAVSIFSPPRVTLVVPQVVNETGNARLDPLARASNEVLIAAAGRIGGAAVVRGADPSARGRVVVVTGRLVMWSGLPTLMLSATDRRSGRIVWQAVGGAGEDHIPPTVGRAMQDLGQHLPR